jgi:hypothetical protein
VLDCFLEGVVQITDCTLEGTAVITVPPPPPPCERPEGLIQDAFFTGYDIIAPPSNIVSTGSLSDACDAVAYLNTFGESYENLIPTYILAEYQGLYVGSYVYTSNGTNNCDTIPDGWYFTGETQANNTVIHVVGGVIVEIVDCTSTTTTSTTTATPECDLDGTAEEITTTTTTTNFIPN